MPFTDQSSDIILYFMNCEMGNFGNINNNDPNKYSCWFCPKTATKCGWENEKKKEKGWHAWLLIIIMENDKWNVQTLFFEWIYYFFLRFHFNQRHKNQSHILWFLG